MLCLSAQLNLAACRIPVNDQPCLEKRKLCTSGKLEDLIASAPQIWGKLVYLYVVCSRLWFKRRIKRVNDSKFITIDLARV